MWIAVAAVSLVACGTRTQGVNGSPLAIPDLPGISESIANTALYPANTFAITSNARQLRIAIRDAKLPISGEGTRNAAAGNDWHIEDLVQLRKGPSGRFSVHIT